MIASDEQLQTTWQSLGIAYQSLAELRQRLLAKNLQAYEVSAQPAWREIAKLRADIAAYLGLDKAEPLDEPIPFVIENDQQLQGTNQALLHLYRALAALRKHLPPESRNYALYAEGNIDEILKLEAEIDCYLGLTHATPGTPALRETPPPFGQPKGT
jgi:hypothetical protein